MAAGVRVDGGGLQAWGPGAKGGKWDVLRWAGTGLGRAPAEGRREPESQSLGEARRRNQSPMTQAFEMRKFSVKR